VEESPWMTVFSIVFVGRGSLTIDFIVKTGDYPSFSGEDISKACRARGVPRGGPPVSKRG